MKQQRQLQRQKRKDKLLMKKQQQQRLTLHLTNILRLYASFPLRCSFTYARARELEQMRCSLGDFLLSDNCFPRAYVRPHHIHLYRHVYEFVSYMNKFIIHIDTNYK